MKSLSILASVLPALALAGPNSLRYATRQTTGACPGEPSADQVKQAIFNWRSDVVTVNAFLDNPPAAGSADIVSMTQATLTKASDEPVELGIFAAICELNQPGQAAYFQAVQTLMTQFGTVLTALMAIINNPNDQAFVTSQINVINQVRCLAVLPLLDNIWATAAAQFGITGQVATDVPREAACAAITGSG